MDFPFMREEELEVLEVLAEGEGWTSYKVSWKQYKEPYVLKRISKSVLDSATFSTEMKFYHPNIINNYRYWVTDEYYFYLTDYLPETICDLVKSTGPLPEETFVNYARSMLESLHFFHQHNIFFDNLQASNYLVDRHNRIKLCDIRDPHLKRSSIGKHDVFALGIIFYFMISGLNPVDELVECSDMQKRLESLSNNIIFPRKISCEIKHLIRCCLKYNENTSIYDLLQLPLFRIKPISGKRHNSSRVHQSTQVTLHYNFKPIPIKCGRMV